MQVNLLSFQLLAPFDSVVVWMNQPVLSSFSAPINHTDIWTRHGEVHKSHHEVFLICLIFKLLCFHSVFQWSPSIATNANLVWWASALTPTVRPARPTQASASQEEQVSHLGITTTTQTLDNRTGVIHFGPSQIVWRPDAKTSRHTPVFAGAKPVSHVTIDAYTMKWFLFFDQWKLNLWKITHSQVLDTVFHYQATPL